MRMLENLYHTCVPALRFSFNGGDLEPNSPNIAMNY